MPIAPQLPQIKYVNHNGDSIILMGDNLTYIDVDPLRSFEWSYVLSNSVSGMGGRATSFSRRPRVIPLEIRMRGFNRAQAIAQFNRLQAITETDCIAEEPGRLYVGNQYLVCYLAVASSVTSALMVTNFVIREVQCLVTEPYWCTEDTTVFNIASHDELDTTGKKYNFKYPYRYGSGYTTGEIVNAHYAPCPAVITIYGPCENPPAIIAGTTINVDVQLTSSDRLVIDQTSHQIYTLNVYGQKTNVFNARNKQYDIFRKIPVGRSNVLYDGSFKMVVTLIRQRSELEWTV